MNEINNVMYNLESKKVLILSILIIILLWRVLKNNIIILLAIGYLTFTNLQSNNGATVEKFDKTGTVFADIGEPKYDLKGERYWYWPPEYDIPQNVYSCCRH